MSMKNRDTQTEIIELVKLCKIFSSLDEAALGTLAASLEHIDLSQGQVLFNEGDYSDSLYILISGRLFATLISPSDIKVIGFIEPGETVGELGALSNQPRSLTVQALVDSKLFKLSKEHFREFSSANPSLALEIISSIITRSQQTIKLLSEKIHRHIAIFPANDTINMDDFLINLRDSLSTESVIIFSDVGEQAQLGEEEIVRQVEAAEKRKCTILYLIENDQNFLARFSAKKVDSIFIVTEAKEEQQGKFSEFIATLLERKSLSIEVRFELVLLHEQPALVYHNTRKWLAKHDFYICHHVGVKEISDYQRLSRFIVGNAVGVVLGGGGAKAWAEMGVIKALLEASINIDAIGGTSAGSLVAACYARFESFQKMFSEFKQLTSIVHRPFALRNFTWPIVSVLSGEKGTHALQKIFEDIDIEDLRIPFFCVTCNLTKRHETIHLSGKLWEKLRGSVSLPGIIPPLVQDGDLHVDGGLLNNLPVDAMRELLGYSNVIIAVSLAAYDEDRRRYNFPPSLPFKVALAARLGITKHDYSFPPFFDTFLQSLLLGASNKEHLNSLQADILIMPPLKGFTMLSLSATEVEQAMQIGYEEATAKLINLKSMKDVRRKVTFNVAKESSFAKFIKHLHSR